MTTLAPSNRRIVTPEVVGGSPCRGPADLRTEKSVLGVTLDLPGFSLAELRWEVRAKSLVVRSSDPSRPLELVITFDKPVCPGRFVARSAGSIFEVTMERK